MSSRECYRLHIFPHLTPLACFLVPSTVYIFSRALRRLHIFPRLKLHTGCMFFGYIFSRALRRLHIFPRLKFHTGCMFSRVRLQLHVFPRLTHDGFLFLSLVLNGSLLRYLRLPRVGRCERTLGTFCKYQSALFCFVCLFVFGCALLFCLFFFRHSGTHRTNQDFLFGLTILNTQVLFKSRHYSRERPCLGHYIVHSDWLIPWMPRQNALGNCLTADRYWWLLCARGIIGGSWMLRTS